MAAVCERTRLIDNALPVYPDPFQTERRNIHSTRTRGQIRNTAFLAAADGLRVEQDDIRVGAGHEAASIRNAIGIGKTAAQHLYRLFQRQIASLTDPMAE